MRINTIQNQSYTHACRKSNENKIAFQGFDMQDVKNDLLHSLKYETANINTVADADSKIKDAKTILKILEPFDNAKFDLNVYRDRFSGNKQVAFDELLKKLDEDAKDLPVIVKRGGLRPEGLTYVFPKGSGIENIFHYGVSNHGRYKFCVAYGSKTKIDLEHIPELWRMLGVSNYFRDFPKSVDAIKEFIVNCIDELVLSPRAAVLDKEDAKKLARDAANKLKNVII